MNKTVNEIKYGGVIEHTRTGCNGYRSSELDPECETKCSALIPALEELGVIVTNPPRRDYGRLRIIRWGVEFDKIMERVGCYGCEK